MAADEQAAPWRNRIVGERLEWPEDLLANPMNWRIHPQAQQDALGGVLDEVGWVQNIVVNLRSGEEWVPGDRNVETLVDGHLRVTLAMRRNDDLERQGKQRQQVPVVLVDLSPAEEALILASFDATTNLAVTDAQKLDELLREVQTGGNPAIEQMLANLAESAGVTPPNFQPTSADEQGRLDEKKQVTCPGCGRVFTP